VVQLFIDHLREFIIRAAPDQVPEATKKRARAAGLKAGRATP
jgi:hypothetical protein